jgi:hypothetical protein
MSPCLVDGCAEGVGVNWRPLIEFVVSVGYGVLSSVIPIFNSEIYIVASQVGGFTDEVTTAVGCAVGQAIGKVGIVLAIRRGSRSRTVQRLRERRERPRKPAGRVRTRLRPWRTGFWNSLVITGGEYPLFSSPPASLFRRCTQ